MKVIRISKFCQLKRRLLKRGEQGFLETLRKKTGMPRFGIFILLAFGSLTAILDCSPRRKVFDESLAASSSFAEPASAAGRRPVLSRLTSWSVYAPFGPLSPQEQEVFRG